MGEPTTTATARDRRIGRIGRIAFALIAIGVFVAAVLTLDHFQYMQDPFGASSVCGAGGGCRISRVSRFSEVVLHRGAPGVPLSLIQIGALAAALALLFRIRGRGPAPHIRDAWRLFLSFSVASVGISAALGTLSLLTQGQLCPWCTGLYAINVALLICAIASRPEPLLRGLFESIGALASRPAAEALAAFILAIGIGYGAYAAPLLASADAREARSIARAAELMRADPIILEVTDRPFIGPKRGEAAPVVDVVVFADFACPYCKTLHEDLSAIQAARPTQVRLIPMNFPLDGTCNEALGGTLHPNACLLARAAICGPKLGARPTLPHALYELGHGAERDDVDRLMAAQVDARAFATCLDAPETDAAVRADIALGRAAGVRSTPTFFIDGHIISGARSRAVVDALISAALAPKEPTHDP